MKTSPVSETHPTLSGLAKAVNRTHVCLDEARSEIAAIGERIERIEAALGLGDHRKKVAGLASAWQAFRRNVLATTTSIVGFALVYKLAILALPGLLLIAAAVHQAALHGVF